MERMFGLIKNDQELPEKRTLPHFPFCYMTFRCRCPKGNDMTFEVTDLSQSGMQVSTRDGHHGLEKGQMVEGELHSLGQKFQVKGTLQWATGKRAGLLFQNIDEHFVSGLLSVQSSARRLKAIHDLIDQEFMAHIPVGLRYWLHADGPIELFFWQHPDHEWKTIQAIYMDSFLEWEDGRGVITGRTLSKRDLDTPLIQEDEFVFGIDQDKNLERVEKIRALVQEIPEGALPIAAKEFFLRKI